MDKIIVSIKDNNRTFSCDIEVPVDKPGKDLCADIFEVLGPVHPELSLNADYHCIKIEKLNRKLGDGETLADADVFNGDYITIVSRM